MAIPSARLRPLHGHRGVALITALLVVALATVAAVAMAARQQLDVRRTANLLDGDQAYAYAEAVEGWGRMILARDAKDNMVDKLDDTWAQQLPPIAVPGGQIGGYIIDLQGRFNLNNLLDASGQPSPMHIAYFTNLLDALQLSQDLINPLLDWLDSDFNPRFPGAEDDTYLNAEVPYRAANRPLASISELRLIKGIDVKIWQVLAPHVCVLPTKTTLNINTASAVLLQAIDPSFSLQDGEQLVAARPDSGYASVNEFVDEHQARFSGQQVDQAVLGVTSEHFLVRSEIAIGTARARVFSVVQRHANGSLVLARTQGTW